MIGCGAVAASALLVGVLASVPARPLAAQANWPPTVRRLGTTPQTVGKNQTGLTALFEVTNNSDVTENMTFRCTRTGVVTGCTAPSDSFINARASIRINVTYSTAGPAVGTLTLVARAPSTHFADSATYDIAVRTVVTREVVAGGGHACGLDDAGRAYCWGSNQDGQLGTGTAGGSQPAPVAVSGNLTFTKLAAGADFTCGIVAGGAAHCWGANWGGQLGDGSTGASRATPAPVGGGHAFRSLALGWEHACGVRTDGAGYCWGGNQEGQRGDGTTSPSTAPVLVSGGHTWDMIATSQFHSCGVTTAGAAYCWGTNRAGELGDGRGGFTGTERSLTPVAVAGQRTWARVTVGGSIIGQSCGVGSGADAWKLYCWGYDRNRYTASPVLGLGLAPPDRCAVAGLPPEIPDEPDWCARTPTLVAGGLTVTDVGAGGSTICALDASDRVYCWGNGENGRIGDAEVSIDLGHRPGKGPETPHVGYQTPGKKGSGGGVRGHIFLDDVPYNRPK